MLRSTNISLQRAWYTWSQRPIEMVFLPLGVRLTPLAYAGSIGKATLFPSSVALRFGRHTLDARLVEAETEHAGTKLAWAYSKPDPFVIQGSWKTLRNGEWGLRFWVNLCLSAECGTTATFDPAENAAILKIGQRFIALFSQESAVQVTGHETIEAAAQDYETNGYFDTRTRSLAAPIIMLRFNLEMMPANLFGCAVADDRQQAIAAARAACAHSDAAQNIATQTGRNAGCLDAVRDVMAWNTVWDTLNHRAYTSISRNWNQQKFGGFGVWLNDQLFHTLLTSVIDRPTTQDNLATALANATPQGNLACLLTARDAWVDRTQPPIGAFILWLIYLRLGQRDMLEQAYPILARNHAWWWQHRDPDGVKLCSYGTSDVGEALYKRTAFGARNESCMDNAPIHDEALFDPQTGCLSTRDVGLNSLLTLDAEMLSAIAAELGKTTEAAHYTQIAERTRALVRDTFWDESRSIFANRLPTGAFVRSVGPTSFYALIAGIATQTQAEALIGHLADPQMFGGKFILPSVARNDPAYRDNTYWRGRIWPPLNFLIWQGLRRYGRTDLASGLAEASLDLFKRSWDEHRLCPENFNAETGEALDQPDTEGFYGWGALMPLMGVAEIVDLSPWAGWSIVNTGEAATLRNIELPTGPATITVAGGRLRLAAGEKILFETNVEGALRNLIWQHGFCAVTLPPCGNPDAEFCLPGVAATDIMQITLEGGAVAATPLGSGVIVALGACPSPRRLVVQVKD